MRRFLVLLAAITALGIVLAHDHGNGNGGTLDDHPHMLVQRPQFGFVMIGDTERLAVVGWRKCVDLAAGRNVPLNAHHEGIHTGSAGQALFENARHWVIPGAPITPWANCAALTAALPIPLPEAE